MKLIALTGRPGCGRRTVAKWLASEYGYLHYRFPEIEQFGTPENRILQAKSMFRELSDDANLVISNCFYTQEAVWVHSLQGTVIYVTRPGLLADAAAPEIPDEMLDYTVASGGSIYELIDGILARVT